MTTRCPTYFFLFFVAATTPRIGVFTSFVIISDSDNEITTLPIRPVPPSPDRTPALYVYPLDSGDDSSDEDLSDTAKSLHTQSASTLVVHTSPTQSLPASLYLLLSSELPSSSCKRSRPLPPSLLPLVPPPPEHIESLGDNLEAIIWNLERHPGPQTDRLEERIAGNTSNKRKREGDHKESSSQQQNKEPKVIRAHTAGPSNKEGYARNLPLCNKCMFHHTSPCAAKCGNYKQFGHQTRYCRTQSSEQNKAPQ
uniref:Reverse transcriptase domain-containing protein n=1 Tax=Tanacetum cinerariifolium TaxID=118510 RepID=A0A6L2JPU1_TANCI|nr:reverse transcriptase domain-containing protein [Tanacetum cinerariifolium]